LVLQLQLTCNSRPCPALAARLLYLFLCLLPRLSTPLELPPFFNSPYCISSAPITNAGLNPESSSSRLAWLFSHILDLSFTFFTSSLHLFSCRGTDSVAHSHLLQANFDHIFLIISSGSISTLFTVSDLITESVLFFLCFPSFFVFQILQINSQIFLIFSESPHSIEKSDPFHL